MRTRVAALAGLLGALCLAGCGDDSPSPAGGDAAGEASVTRVDLVPAAPRDSEFDPQALYERLAPGVVTVVSLFASGGVPGDDRGVGSGFVLSRRGEVVTNAHVVTSGEGEDVEPAREVFVEFADGNKVSAEVVGEDFNTDVALLRLDPEGLRLRPLPLGRSADIEVGQPVAAIGSPFGQRQSLSVGVVSAIDRSIRSLTEFDIPGAIQTDAAINPGNSGGPLVDARGQVIGINQQIRSSTGGSEGVGFAVPVDRAKRSISELREDGSAEYAYLGVSSVELYPQLVERFELPVRRGVWLQVVSDGGPAADAGLRGASGREVTFQGAPFGTGGDVVTRVGDEPIRDGDDLALAVTRYDPGDEVTLEIWRDGTKRRFEVTLGERPASSDDLP